MIKKLVVAALVALVAAPAVSMHQLCLQGVEAASFVPDAGARLVSAGALLSTGLI